MGTQMLEEVRQRLLDEAQRSPALLSDLAGLEQYIAESYDSRSFVELLQNADDAGAALFVIERTRDTLLVANDGRPFSHADFESLCRSAASTKSRGNSIGYRGIGFKSVVGFAQTIHLVSGDLRTTFSRERTQSVVPGAVRIPLIRIPHPMQEADEVAVAPAVDRLLSEGLRTVFVFDDLIARGIEQEFAEFDSTSLLFLRSVRQVELRTGTEAVISVRRTALGGGKQSIRIAGPDGATNWHVVNDDEIAIAFARDTSGIVRLSEREAVVHAFLPTLEPTGLGVKIHGDISTDPSRTRVIVDDRTANAIRGFAKMILMMLAECLDQPGTDGSLRTLSALMPVSDPRAAMFQRQGFRTKLLDALKQQAQHHVKDVLIRPAWINPMDFEKFMRVTGCIPIPRHLEGIEGLVPLLRHLGAKEASTEHVMRPLATTAPSLNGAADVVAHLARLHGTGQLDAQKVKCEWRLWAVDGKVLSLAEAQERKRSLDQDFLDMVVERGAIIPAIFRLISAVSGQQAADLLLPDQHSAEAHRAAGRAPLETAKAGRSESFTPTSGQPALSVKRWRKAEQHVVSILTARGWSVKDVSAQNLGYDVEGSDPKGEDAFVEVKSIDRVGEPFVLTSNEEAVARVKGTSYWLALVRQSDVAVEVALLCDPVHELQLARQCRQWVWVCSSYQFAPDVFPLT